MSGGRAWTVATFPSTFDALEAERLCGGAGVAGRLVPTPTWITAECGLAWRMPAAPGARERFERAVAGRVRVAAWFEDAL